MRARMQVGVDLNRVAQNSWQAAPLQFLAGLGPRKAQALIRAVQREQHVLTRHDVWEELRLLGRTVFRCLAVAAAPNCRAPPCCRRRFCCRATPCSRLASLAACCLPPSCKPEALRLRHAPQVESDAV